jgi:L-malate glycosyltransferase
MKIVYFANAEDIHTYKWINYFASKGYEIHLLSFIDSKNFDKFDNVKLHPLKKSFANESTLDNIGVYFTKNMNLGSVFFNPISTLNNIKKLISKINPDIIHGLSIIHHTILAALSNFHPFVVSAYGNDILIYPAKSRICRCAVQFVLKKSDLITSGGDNSKDAMISLGAKPDKLHKISHGVDTKMFTPIASKDKLRNELRIADFPTVISTRRMAQIHDVETLIKSIPPVLKVNPDVRFLLIGNGSERDSLEKLTISLNVQGNVSFIGEVPQETISKYLASADIYVSTSLSDSGIAVSTLEAMSCGIAPIITDVADNSKWVMDGINGYIFPPKDPNKLAEKIINLLGNDEIKYEFGKKNRSIILENADYYREMEKMDRLYKNEIQRYKK